MSGRARVHTPPPGTPDWVADAVFYQIFPDRFASSERLSKSPRLELWESPPTTHGFKGGDLHGVVERLGYLEDLGVNAIYLNPVFSSASNHRYHAYDYYQVDPLLGGNEALRELLDAAHARGMHVILDGVFNHCGRGFWPFHHLLECGDKSPYVDWFTVKGFPLEAYRRKRRLRYEAWWGLPALPKLNVANPETREYLLQVAEHWIRLGADGWRLDVPGEIDVPGFWEEFRARVRAVNPEAYLVGEIWNEAPEWVAGDRFDGLMNYPFACTALGFCAATIRRDLRQGLHRVRPLGARAALRRLERQVSLYHERVVRSQLNLLGSHDCPRFLTFAAGDHSALHLAVLLQMTLPGAPCVYYGDEVGMAGEADPDCRRAFPRDRKAWHRPTLETFRRAIALRRSEPVLRQGDFRAVQGRGKVLAFIRTHGDVAMLVALNAGDEPTRRRMELPDDMTPAGDPVELWSADAEAVRVGASPASSGRFEVDMPARSARVLRWTLRR